MPYADPDEQRRYQREAIRRRRAAHRGETMRPGAESIPPVADAPPANAGNPPAVAPAPPIEDAAPVYDARDLAIAGRVLGHMRTRGEPDAVYRARLREVWLALARVVT